MDNRSVCGPLHETENLSNRKKMSNFAKAFIKPEKFMNKERFLHIALSAIFTAVCFTACHNHESHGDHEEEGETAGEHNHESPGIVHMSSEDAARFGVGVEAVVPGQFCEVVKVAGEVLPSASDVATASAHTSGVISLAPGITQGSNVKAGQLIARVTSKGVTGGDANVAAKVAVENAKRELDRLTPLLADGLVTRKEYNDALGAYNSAKASYSPSASSGSVTAPRSGVITSLVAQEGQFVDTGAPVAVISGAGTVTLRALLPVRDASFIPLVSGAVITPHGSQGEPVDIADYGGRLLSTSANSAETPGYIPVYFTLSSGSPVVPGTAAEVYLKGAVRNGVLTVPVSALTEQLGEKFVYVKHEDGDFEKRPVTIGRTDGIRAEILKGVAEGDSVVSAGLSFVRLAEQATVVPEGHSHNH